MKSYIGIFKTSVKVLISKGRIPKITETKIAVVSRENPIF